MNILIRELEVSEINFLQDMLYKAIFVPVGNDPLPKSIVQRPELKKYYQNWGLENDLAFVAEKNGELIGIAWSRIFKASNKGYGFVDENTPEVSISVQPEHRNQGIGTRLLRSIIHETISRGTEKISLSTDKRNKAVNLYKREGFEVVKENDVDFIMVKSLSRSAV